MSEPRHIYFSTVTAVFQPHIHPKERDNDVRFTQTSGEEWDALIERARACREKKFTHYGEEIRLAECDDVLDDILTYLGEQP